MPLQLRMVEAFLVVAEELSYTRASISAGLSEAVLSKSVRSLEDELGAKLFRRGGPHGLALTEFGHSFRGSASRVARSHDELLDVADRLARGSMGALTIGWPAHGLGRLGTALLRALKERLPEVVVSTVHPDLTAGSSVLAEGRCDLQAVRGQVADPEVVTTRPFALEARLLGVADHSPFARCDDVPLESLGGVPLVPSGRFSAGPPSDAWGPLPTGPDGTSLLAPLRSAVTVDELFARVRTDEGVCIVPDGLAEFYRPPGLTFVPLYDLPASLARFAWRADTTNPSVAAALPIVLEVAAARPELGGLQTAPNAVRR